MKIRFIEAFSTLGRDWLLSNDVHNTIEKFVCLFYAHKCKVKSVDELRYLMFRGKEEQIESFRIIPPCKDTLGKLNKNANYQAEIPLRSLDTKPL